jgi:hypothetical protein
MKQRLFILLSWILKVFLLSGLMNIVYPQQQPLIGGELVISAGYSTLIKVEAVSVVWGIWQNNYPVRSDLRCTYEITDPSCGFDHVGDNNGRPLVGYGRYKITIDNHSTYVDYRDCDYNGPNYPAGYFSPDIEVTYKKTHIHLRKLLYRVTFGIIGIIHGIGR